MLANTNVFTGSLYHLSKHLFGRCLLLLAPPGVFLNVYEPVFFPLFKEVLRVKV
jgi:hypothetical protein